jgi:hypothetical protein
MLPGKAPVTAQRGMARRDHHPVHIKDLFRIACHGPRHLAGFASAVLVIGQNNVASPDLFNRLSGAIPHRDEGSGEEALV